MISVVVPVKDRRERMLRCLDALLAQDHDDFEVVVMDGGSHDGTPEACAERAREARVPVTVKSIPGPVGRQRNRGAALARGELIAFTDSDCLPDPGWLRAGERPLLDDPRVGVVTGPTLPETEPEGPWAATQRVEAPTGLFEGCNVFFRRAALEAGGFDEQLTWFWEDAAAGWAALRRGWRHVFEPRALVLHDVTHPGLGWWLRRAQAYAGAAKLAHDFPEVRRELLWARVFLRRRNAAVAAAVLGVALAPLDRRALVLGAPYGWLRAPRSTRDVREAAGTALFDLAVLAGTLRGSARWRSLVI